MSSRANDIARMVVHDRMAKHSGRSYLSRWELHSLPRRALPPQLRTNTLAEQLVCIRPRPGHPCDQCDLDEAFDLHPGSCHGRVVRWMVASRSMSRWCSIASKLSRDRHLFHQSRLQQYRISCVGGPDQQRLRLDMYDHRLSLVSMSMTDWLHSL